MDLSKRLNAVYNGNYQGCGKVYKWKYLCCECKKSFKRISEQDLKEDEISQQPHSCPECGNQTLRIGPKFRPPKKSDDSRWNSLKVLLKLKFSHFFSWSTDEIEIPNSKSKLKSLLEELEQYSKQQMDIWSRSDYGDASEQVRGWHEKHKAINSELQKLK